MPTNADLTKPTGRLFFFRIAWQLCRQSKPELIEMVKAAERENVHESTLDGLRDAAEFFEKVVELLHTAEWRFLIAASALGVEREKA